MGRQLFQKRDGAGLTLHRLGVGSRLDGVDGERGPRQLFLPQARGIVGDRGGQQICLDAQGMRKHSLHVGRILQQGRQLRMHLRLVLGVRDPPGCSNHKTGRPAGPSDDAEVLVPGGSPAKARAAKDAGMIQQPGAADSANARCM